MSDAADVCVLLPTLDESATVSEVIQGYRAEGFDDILVIDAGSSDDTPKLAREAGARVVGQTGTGKGQAIQEAVREHIDAEFVLMVDADATYDATDAHALLEPLLTGEADHVIGNRFADMQPQAMSRLNRFGNRFINWAFKRVHGENYRDILSGYRAFRRDSFAAMNLSTEGFGIETEMSVECVKNDVPVAVVPVTYRPRPAGSSTNLHPISDGGVIFLEMYRKAKTNNPLFYFGSVGLLSTLLGGAMAGFVIYRWVVFNTGHEIIALAGAAAIILGIQLLIFGFLADMILTLHREQISHRERINEIED